MSLYSDSLFKSARELKNKEDHVLTFGRHTRNKTNEIGNSSTSIFSNKKPTFKLMKNLFPPSRNATPKKNETVKNLKLNLSNTAINPDITKNFIKKDHICNEETCNSIKLLVKYQVLINELTKENERLKQINSFFMINMGLKDDYILKLLNQNSSLYNELNNAGYKSEKHGGYISKDHGYKERESIEKKSYKEIYKVKLTERSDMEERSGNSKKNTIK